jgi:hypothetical protein
LNEKKVEKADLNPDIAKSELIDINIPLFDLKKKLILPNMIIIKEYELNEEQILI